MATSYAQVENYFMSFYGQQMINLKCPLKITRDERMENNAYAYISNDLCKINVASNLLDNTKISEDAQSFIICHELGHLIAGAPYNITDTAAVVTVEGEADYYAALKCMRNILPLIKTESQFAEKENADFYLKKCQTHHQNIEDQKICVRTIYAVM